MIPHPPSILCALSLPEGRFWRGAPGGLLLLRTDALPRGAGPVRVVLRVALGARRGRWTLRPSQVDEEGLVLVRLPRALPRALLSLRLCVGGRASPARLLLAE